MEVIGKYIYLLKNAIWGTDMQVDVQPEEVLQIVQLSAFQGTGPLVFDQLLKQKDVEIPAALRMQMKQQCMMSMMQQSTMMPILGQAWKAFEKAEIHPVLLKGFALAQHYPQPHLRQWDDIDLYVGQKQYHDACAVLREAFPEAKHPEEEFEFLKHYNFVFGDTVLEMHRISMDFHHPRDRRYYEGLEEKYLTKDGPSFELNEIRITTPDETFNVFFTFLHAWHHFMETGMNMKQVCDIAILLHAIRDVLDRERLKEMLTKLHMMEVWQLVMYILVQHLGLPHDEAPFYTERCKERAELLFKRILKEGSSRKVEHINAEGASYLKRKWITLQSRMADSRMIKPYAPKYARHMAISDILHGIERTIKGSEKAYNVECV